VLQRGEQIARMIHVLKGSGSYDFHLKGISHFIDRPGVP
jgi:hypothetical protein